MRQIRVSRIDTNRDPGVPGAVWYSGAGSINEPTPPTPAEAAFERLQAAASEPLTIDAYYEVLPEPPEVDVQHNDHVMKYWTWRLDRLEAKRNG